MIKAKGKIILEDGAVFSGEISGSHQPVTGEIVFNTSMVGYQEVLTDPSYAGQMVVMTYPLMGNYGVNPLFSESPKIHARAVIARELWEGAESRGIRIQLEDFLNESAIPIVTGVDTRALTRYIRQHGAMKAVVAPTEWEAEDVNRILGQAADFGSHNFIPEVTCAQATYYAARHQVGHIAIIDLGLKKGILDGFLARGYSVTVLPANAKANDVLSLNADAVLFSNGPGNPVLLTDQVKLAGELLGHLPVFGICLGHQVIALALGAKVHKLKFGHRGGNHPVRDLLTRKVFITAQNHGYTVSEEGLSEKGLFVTHRNLNDGTVEGLSHKDLSVFTVQFHPESSPGPLDAAHLFEQFISNFRQENKAS